VLWRTADLLKQRQALIGRPKSHGDLLLEPIPYDGWEEDHAEDRRFYLAGVVWFKRTFKAKQKTVDLARDQAHRRVLALTKWHLMSDPEGYWKKELGRPQVLSVFAGEPISFAKAAQVLMACEIVVENILSEKEKEPAVFAERGLTLPDGFSKAEHLHRYMGILPACWNIDGFNKEFLEKVRHHRNKDPHKEIADAIGLRSPYAVAELTRGHTVTRLVAENIQSVASGFEVPDNYLGQVRARPGRKLGKKSASEFEAPDLF
jgi:hypothetical protein